MTALDHRQRGVLSRALHEHAEGVEEVLRDDGEREFPQVERLHALADMIAGEILDRAAASEAHEALTGMWSAPPDEDDEDYPGWRGALAALAEAADPVTAVDLDSIAQNRFVQDYLSAWRARHIAATAASYDRDSFAIESVIEMIQETLRGGDPDSAVVTVTAADADRIAYALRFAPLDDPQVRADVGTEDDFNALADSFERAPGR